MGPGWLPVWVRKGRPIGRVRAGGRGESMKRAAPKAKSKKYPKKARTSSYNPQASVVAVHKGEAKSYDGIIATTIASSGAIVSLYENLLATTTITQGTGEAQYIGDTITPLYITIRGLFVHSDSNQALRVIVFQTIGNTVPSVAILMQLGSGTYSGADYSLLSPVKKNTRRQYTILRDKLYTSTSYSDAVRAFKIKIPMYSLQITEFSDASGTVGTGGLYIFLQSDSTAVTHPTVRIVHRVTYTDS